EGRIGRGPFWIGNAVVALALFAIERFTAKSGHPSAGQIIAFAGAFALYPWCALASQRAQDRGWPALYGITLVILIMLAALAAKLVPNATASSAFGLVSGIAWLVALVDLGLMPGQRFVVQQPSALAASRANAKPAQ
ncbi:MAG: DUF805 domain-containing protein, partial [Bosea sp. (in: a-proteobacteria)]